MRFRRAAWHSPLISASAWRLDYSLGCGCRRRIACNRARGTSSGHCGRPYYRLDAPDTTLSRAPSSSADAGLRPVLDFRLGVHRGRLQINRNRCPALARRMLGTSTARIYRNAPSLTGRLAGSDSNTHRLSSDHPTRHLDSAQSSSDRVGVGGRRCFVCVVAKMARLVRAAGQRNCGRSRFPWLFDRAS